MRFAALTIAALVAALCTVAPARAEADGDVNIFIGVKVPDNTNFSATYQPYDTVSINVSGFHIGALVGWGW